MRARLTALMLLTLSVAACAGVLGIQRRDTTHPFEHRAHVTHGINCKECHADMATSGDEGPIHLPSKQDCLRCHATPHDTRDCNGCHGESHVRASAQLARDHLRFSHSRHMTQVKGDCVRCHEGVAEARPYALRPAMATCFGCHEHRDQWQVRDCEGCHVDLPGERVLPSSHVVHEGDWVREHGTRAATSRDLCDTCHTERSCAQCHGAGHVPALPSRMAFDDARLSGQHRAGFRARHAEEARAQPGLCSTCHAESTCQDCHTRSGVSAGLGKRSPHPAGWIAPTRGGGDHGVQARIDPESCAGCHGGAGEQLCVDCHKVGAPGGNPHGRGFRSTKDKVHDVPCRACHGGAL